MLETPRESIVGDFHVNTLDPNRRDLSWPARLAVMNIYYAQRRYFELNNQQYASNLSAVEKYIDPMILKPFMGSILITLSKDSKAYNASVVAPNNIKTTITEERRLTVELLVGNTEETY